MENEKQGKSKSLLLTSAAVAILAPLLKEHVHSLSLLEGAGLASLMPFLEHTWEAGEHIVQHVMGVEAHETFQEKLDKKRHVAETTNLSKVTGDVIASILRQVAADPKLEPGSERKTLEKIASGASKRWQDLPIAPIEETELRELFSLSWERLRAHSLLPVEAPEQAASWEMVVRWLSRPDMEGGATGPMVLRPTPLAETTIRSVAKRLEHDFADEVFRAVTQNPVAYREIQLILMGETVAAVRELKAKLESATPVPAEASQLEQAALNSIRDLLKQVQEEIRTGDKDTESRYTAVLDWLATLDTGLAEAIEALKIHTAIVVEEAAERIEAQVRASEERIVAEIRSPPFRDILAFTLAPAISRALLKRWLKEAVGEIAAGSVKEMLTCKPRDPFAVRSGARAAEVMGEKVVEELEPLFATEEGLEDSARALVAEAAAVRILEVDPTGLLPMQTDMDAGAYARRLLESAPESARRFSSAQAALYRRVVEEIARSIVMIADSLLSVTEATLVEVLRRETQLLEITDRILAELASLRRAADTGASTVGGREFEHRYRTAVRTRLDWTELFGADLTEASRRQPLTTAYVTLTTTGAEKSAAAGAMSVGTAVSVEEALLSGKRLLVRGDPGSGKTTLLKWVAVRAAYGDFEDRLAALRDSVPFFLRLREIYDKLPLSPDAFPKQTVPLLAETPPPDWLIDRLNSGRAFVLVDGVDEVPEAQRQRVLSWLTELVGTYPNARYLVSSRSVAVPADWMAAEGFRSFELQPMAPDAVFRFVDKWHAAVEQALPGEADRERVRPLADRLRKTLALPEHRALRGLATNPLLCALLCALHRERGGEVPRDRIMLYEACCNMLAWRRDADSQVHVGAEMGLDQRRRLALLEHLAYYMMRNGRDTLLWEEAVESLESPVREMHAIPAETTAEQVLRLLLERACLIREVVKGEIDFAHLTLQEFLAARAALTVGDEGFLLERAGEDRWREVIVLAAALGRDTRPDSVLARIRLVGRAERVSVGEWLIRELLRRADRDARLAPRYALLAVACLEGAISVSEPTQKAVRARLKDLAPPRTLRDADALAAAGDIAVPYLTAKPERDAGEAAACVRALVRIGAEAAREALTGYRDDLRPEVRVQWALGADINPIDGAAMVTIPAGEFLMGDEDESDAPPRRVYLDAYRLYVNPVTVWQYRKFCTETGRKMPSAPTFNKNWRNEDHPMVNVDWEDAVEYGKWTFGDDMNHLPTEAQWEKAARGTDGRTYPWGAEWDVTRCRCSKRDYGDAKGTASVGSYPSGMSPYGCLDMAGNVWEWCADLYDENYYKSGEDRNPTGPKKGIGRVLRGGSWNYLVPEIFRAARRGGGVPGDWDVSVGFRCVSRSDSD